VTWNAQRDAVRQAKQTVVYARGVLERVRRDLAEEQRAGAFRTRALQSEAVRARGELREARSAVLEAKLAVLQAQETILLEAQRNRNASSVWLVEPPLPGMHPEVVTIGSPYAEPPVPDPIFVEPPIPASSWYTEPAIPVETFYPVREAAELQAQLEQLVVPVLPTPAPPVTGFDYDEDFEERIHTPYVPSTNRLPSHVLVTYICKELLLYFGMAFIFFFLVFFVNQILLMAQDILKYQVPLQDVARLIFFSLPFTIAQSAPMATIVGFLMCLGRMMTDNEVLIFRASGRSYALLLAIVLSLGMGITATSFMVNDYLLPAGISSYNQLYRLVSVANPAVVLKSDSVTKTNDLTVVVGTVTQQEVEAIVFFDTDKNRNQRIIVARSATVGTPSDKSVLMQLNMSDVTLVSLNPNKRGDYDVITSEEVNMNLFASTIFKPSANRNPNEYPYLELRKQLQELRANPNTSKNALNSYSLELNKKFSMPFGALFFAFLALPLAIIFGKHNGQTIGLIIGLFLSFMYWAMIIVGQRLAIRSGFNGTIMMWLPDALIAFFALVFFIGLRRR
jgi:lipopolysaccharide export system permease protein